MVRTIALFLVLFSTYTQSFSQIAPPVSLDELDTNPQLNTLFEKIETQSKYFITYNPSSIDLSESILLEAGQNILDINEILDLINDQLGYEYNIDHLLRKVILYPRKYKYITGIIRDSASLETLPGVAIYTADNSGNLTNEEGFFTLRLDNNESKVFLSFLGYKTKILKTNQAYKTNYTIQMIYDNRLPEIIIKDNLKSSDYQPEFNPRDVAIKDKFSAKSISGSLDLVSQIKLLPGVSNGSEAQNGFIVRGGGPDQNLVLLDGLPIYEVSHLGGLASIFMENTTKKADLYKTGIPARFGGKLSSVLDVRLKDGNRNEYKRQIGLGLNNLTGTAEGPLGPKTSFIVSGRTSTFNLYTRPILSRYLNISGSDFSYSDIYTKLSFWINDYNRLSLSLYQGNDNIALTRNSVDIANTSYSDSNRINWSNNLFSVNWKRHLGSKVFMHTQFGRAAFNYKSKNQLVAQDATGHTTTTVSATSCQSNLSGNINLDIYTDAYGKIKTGVGLIQHSSQPSIIEQSLVDNFEECGDSTYLTKELYFFAENRLQLSESWNANFGIRVNNFFGVDSNYFYIQPRFNLQYKDQNRQFNFGYSRMNQFLHLLVNPSSGLPSDLWVPSTDKIAPQLSNLFSVDYSMQINNKLKASIGLFYNQYFNIVEYRDAVDLFQGIVIDETVFNIQATSISWEDRITKGIGESRGVELEVNYKGEKLAIDLAYTYSRSIRTLIDSDEQETTFRYKFDKPHDISISLSYNLNKTNSFNISWVFANGNRWTYPTRSVTINDITFLESDQRNNVSLRNYHHLDLSYRHLKQIIRPNDLELSFGIYNVYNRRNAFYGYPIIGDEIPPEIEVVEGGVPVVHVTLYPIIPQINAKFKW